MSAQTVESKLIAELTDKQQELVSGGGQLVDLDQFDDIAFENQIFGERKTLNASRDRSTITKQVMNDYAASDATEELLAQFD
jgi:hypothetical protein